MQEQPPIGNVALLIDADNASARHIDPVLTVLADLGTVNLRRAVDPAAGERGCRPPAARCL